MFSRNAPIFSIKRRIARTARCCRSKEEAVCPSAASWTTHLKHSKAQQKKSLRTVVFSVFADVPLPMNKLSQEQGKMHKNNRRPGFCAKAAVEKTVFFERFALI